MSKNKIIISTTIDHYAISKNVGVMKVISVPKATNVKLILQLLNCSAGGIYNYEYSVVDRMPRRMKCKN